MIEVGEIKTFDTIRIYSIRYMGRQIKANMHIISSEKILLYYWVAGESDRIIYGSV